MDSCEVDDMIEQIKKFTPPEDYQRPSMPARGLWMTTDPHKVKDMLDQANGPSHIIKEPPE